MIMTQMTGPSTCRWDPRCLIFPNLTCGGVPAHKHHTCWIAMPHYPISGGEENIFFKALP